MSARYTDKDLARLQAHIEQTGSPKGFVPTAKRRYKHEESQHQRAVVQWWRAAARGMQHSPLLLMAFPNAAKRDPVSAGLLKAEGMVPGAPDLFLFVPRSHYHGLAIEMKTAIGRLSPVQKDVHFALELEGYKVVICRSFNEAKAEIERYLWQ